MTNEELLDDLFAGVRWDSSDPRTAMLAAYRLAEDSRKNKPMTTTHETRREIISAKSISEMVNSGVRACMLALDTIEQLEGEDGPREQLLISGAHSILESWGIDLKPRAPREAKPEEPNLWPALGMPQPPSLKVLDKQYTVTEECHGYSDPTAASPVTIANIKIGTRLSFAGQVMFTSGEEVYWLLVSAPAITHPAWVQSNFLQPVVADEAQPPTPEAP